MDIDSPNTDEGQSRRRFLGKAAVATGAIWSAPAILGTTEAFAAGSAGVPGEYCAPVTLPAAPVLIGAGPGGASAAGSVNFGHGFSVITSVCWKTWFINDLWDLGEQYRISLVGGATFGQNNQSGPSQTLAIVCLGANLIPSMYTGAFDFNYLTQIGTMQIERAQVCITGTPS